MYVSLLIFLGYEYKLFKEKIKCFYNNWYVFIYRKILKYDLEKFIFFNIYFVYKYLIFVLWNLKVNYVMIRVCRMLKFIGVLFVWCFFKYKFWFRYNFKL